MRDPDWQIRMLHLIFRVTFDHNFFMQQAQDFNNNKPCLYSEYHIQREVSMRF